jgi:hypothetical protein
MMVTVHMRRPSRLRRLWLLTAVLALPPMADAAARGREPLILPQVGDTFGAPYDVVWDATLKNLGVLKIVVADKPAGRIETEPFPFTFTVGSGPGGAPGPLLRVSLVPGAPPLPS